jgi:hypothetical protein
MIQGKKKYTIKEIKSKSPKALLSLINRAKKFLKKNDVMKQVFKDNGVDISFLDYIPIKFGDIDVSATTSHGIITLNYKLLLDGDFFKDYGYLVHEISHYLQQCFRNKPTQGAEEGKYLDNPDEQEGFQNQIQYIAEEFGDHEADKYVEGLLDHHDIDSKKERRNKKDVLMNKI